MRAFDLLAQGRAGHPQRRRTRAITSRWCCCGGCTCASWCRWPTCSSRWAAARHAARRPRAVYRAGAVAAAARPSLAPAGSTPRSAVPSGTASRAAARPAAAAPATAASRRARAPVPALQAPSRQLPAQPAAAVADAPRHQPATPCRRPGATPVPAPLRRTRFLAEIRAGKGFFYNTVVAQAQKIEVTGDKVTFTFLPTHRALREQFEQTRAWLEAAAERVAGQQGHRRRAAGGWRRSAAAAAAPPAPSVATAPTSRGPAAAAAARDLKAEALSSSAVQAMLDVFPARDPGRGRDRR